MLSRGEDYDVTDAMRGSDVVAMRSWLTPENLRGVRREGWDPAAVGSLMTGPAANARFLFACWQDGAVTHVRIDTPTGRRSYGVVSLCHDGKWRFVPNGAICKGALAYGRRVSRLFNVAQARAAEGTRSKAFSPARRPFSAAVAAPAPRGAAVPPPFVVRRGDG